MGNTQLPFHHRLPFVDPPQQHVAEVQRPNAIGDFLKADAMGLQSGRQVQQPGLEANGAGVGDALHEEMAGIFERGQRARVRPGRWAIERAGCAAPQELMRTLLVVLPAKSIKRALLDRERGPRRPDRALREGFVPALVSPVLLRVRRQDALVLNAQAEPPDMERREAMQRRRGERDADRKSVV